MGVERPHVERIGCEHLGHLVGVEPRLIERPRHLELRRSRLHRGLQGGVELLIDHDLVTVDDHRIDIAIGQCRLDTVSLERLGGDHDPEIRRCRLHHACHGGGVFAHHSERPFLRLPETEQSGDECECSKQDDADDRRNDE